MKAILASDKQKMTNPANTPKDRSVIEKSSDSAKPRYDAAHAATLTGKDKIAYWQEVGISGDELRKRVHAHIDSLPWKK